MSLFFLLNPKQYGTVDTSDILSGLRKKKDQEIEEQIAAQILQARQTDIVIPEKVNVLDIATILKNKVFEPPKTGELIGVARQQRINAFILAFLMDD